MQYLRRLEVRFVRGEFRSLRGRVRTPADIHRIFRKIRDNPQEIVLAIYLTSELDLIAYASLAKGSASATVVPAQELFRGAILLNASELVVIHNHPSGTPTPSDEDRNMLELLANRATVLGKDLLDFMIVGEVGFWSAYAEQVDDAYSTDHDQLGQTEGRVRIYDR